MGGKDMRRKIGGPGGGSAPGPKGELIKEYLAKYDGDPSRTIAKALYKDHPLIFDSTDQAASLVRYYRGNSGEKGRRSLSDKRFVRENQMPGTSPFADLPKPISGWEELKVKKVKGPKVGVFSDLHIPFHDERALDAALSWLKDQKPDSLVALGDICDFYGFSRWTKDPRLVDPERDYLMVKQFWAVLRREFPDCKIYWKEGNHEYRFWDYLHKNAPALIAMRTGLSMEELFDLKKLKIHYSPRIERLEVGPISLMHGHEFNGLSATVNAARGLFNKAKSTAVCGHLHQRSSHTEARLGGKPISTWSIGCLCQLHPDYATINKWSHSVMLIDHSEGHKYSSVENRLIIDGEVV
jgi:predicted phosphodiesterase